MPAGFFLPLLQQYAVLASLVVGVTLQPTTLQRDSGGSLHQLLMSVLRNQAAMVDTLQQLALHKQGPPQCKTSELV